MPVADVDGPQDAVGDPARPQARWRWACALSCIRPSSPASIAAIAAGVGVVAIAALMVWQADTDAGPRAATGLAGGGAALVVVAVVSPTADGGLVRTALTAVLAGVIGVGGAALLRWPRWAGIGCGARRRRGLAASLSPSAAGSPWSPANGGIEPDLWATAGVGIVVAIGIAALRSDRIRGRHD